MKSEASNVPHGGHQRIRDGRLLLERGPWRFEVDPLHGARICSFSLDGRNVLSGPEVDADNYGSTFWTSPQSDWAWPPVAEIDHGPYTVVDDHDGFTCAGAVSSKLGIAVSKRFHIAFARDAVRVDYTIGNLGALQLRYAPWEISRVAGGLTFFESGGGAPEVLPLPVPETVEAQGITWFEYSRKRVSTDQKLFAHTRGSWLAHISGDLVLIKEFPRVPFERQAPGESTLEVFVSGSKDYIEIEQQGAYDSIAPWQSSLWTVHWYLRRLPEGIDVRPNNPELVRWVRDVLSR